MPSLFPDIFADIFSSIARDLNEFDWRELAAFERIGAWPAAVKTSVVVVLNAAIFAGGYLLLLHDLRQGDLRLAREASGLEAQLGILEGNVAKLGDYRQRALEIEAPYLRILRQLPYESEIPALIDDITALGLRHGLAFEAIELGAELDHPHSVEQPIELRMTGGYHGIGAFFGEVAKLGRIVTLHDFSLQERMPGRLELNLQARAYRYRPLSGAFATEPVDGRLTAMPELFEPVPFEYPLEFGRDPFTSGSQSGPADSSCPEIPQADARALQQFALSDLRLVGLLQRGDEHVGLIEDPAGVVHRVAAGDRLGLARGRVEQITAQGLRLTEWPAGCPGGSTAREVLLPWEERP